MHKKIVNRMALKLLRVAEGRNQGSLAREIHRSQSWISRVERGGPCVVTDRDLSGLAATLGVAASDLEGK